MARPRYPSDETRLKRPSGVMVGFSVRNPDPEKPGHAEVFEDPVKRGIWLGLLLVAGQAFAGRTDDCVTLSRGDLIWVTGQPRYDRAVATLRTVCGHMGYEVVQRETAVRQQRGASVTVHVKNLSQNQGWTPQSPRSAPRTPSASDSDSDSDSDTEKKKKPSAIASGGSKRSEKPAPKAEQKPTAVSLFMDGHVSRRGVKYPLDRKKDPRRLNAIFEELGRSAEAFGAMLEQFFALDDPRARSLGWNVTALCERWQKCHQDAQIRARERKHQADTEASLAHEQGLSAEEQIAFRGISRGV